MDRFLASAPVRVSFAGWESDTYRLQNAGWQISADQRPYDYTWQLAFYHPLYKMRGISNLVRDSGPRGFDLGYRYAETVPPIIQVALSSDFISHITAIFDRFEPIDAEPQWIEPKRMSQCVPFAPNLARTQEIIVPEKSVDEILNLLLEKQSDSRSRMIREQVSSDQFKPQQRVHAQIISMVA